MALSVFFCVFCGVGKDVRTGLWCCSGGVSSVLGRVCGLAWFVRLGRN